MALSVWASKYSYKELSSDDFLMESFPVNMKYSVLMKVPLLTVSVVHRWLVCVWMCLAFSSMAMGEDQFLELDGPLARSKISDESSFLLFSENFDELEEMAGEFRKSKARTPEGWWKISFFYIGLKEPGKKGKVTDEQWVAWIAKLEKWKTSNPHSVTARIALGGAMTSYAWFARGSGWASEVKEEGSKLFHERLAAARSILEEAEKMPDKCPELYHAFQTVALGQGWSEKEYEVLFAKAIKLEPEYFTYYFARAYFLLPRWHGREGSWQHFAETSAEQTKSTHGMALYTRICWYTGSAFEGEGDLFTRNQVSWPKMKQGFLDLEKQFPNSCWNLNYFCKFACIAGDKETAQNLFKRIGDFWHPEAWLNLGRFNKWKHWANSDEATELQPKASITFSDAVRGIATSSDNRLLAVGTSAGELVIYDQEGKLIHQLTRNDSGSISRLVFSPDNKLLASCSYKKKIPNQTEGGKIKIWNVDTGAEIGMLSEHNGQIAGLAFSPDGKILASSGGKMRNPSQLVLWDISTLKLNKAFNYPMAIETIAFSPDGKTLAFGSLDIVGLRDSETGEFKTNLNARASHEGWVSVAFSPDGRILASVSAPGKKSRPGTIRLWDSTSGKPLEVVFEGHGASISSVAFSPDGKTLATAGDDESCKLWDVATGKLLNSLSHIGSVEVCTFSADGNLLFTGDDDNTLRIWELKK